MNSILDPALLDPALQALRTQLEAAAAAFAGDSAHLGALLRAMIEDVQRATTEPVEVFPVKHHSPASALHMLRRLRARAPKVIYMEGCEDLNASLAGLHHCRFPVALQAFAPEAAGVPGRLDAAQRGAAARRVLGRVPGDRVLPAEPGHRSWCSSTARSTTCSSGCRRAAAAGLRTTRPTTAARGEEKKSGAGRDGQATEGEGASTTPATCTAARWACRSASMQPTFGDFLDVLLRNAKVRHYSEWWTQYVEATLATTTGRIARCSS